MLLAHGTVSTPEEIPAFLTRIRRGRPAPASLIEEITARYKTIGGSPLLRLTQAQAQALHLKLGVDVLVAMRLSEPTVTSLVQSGRLAGVTKLGLLPLAPFSTHVYVEAAEAELRGAGLTEIEIRAAKPFGLEADFIRANAEQIRATAGPLAPEDQLILSAHSLPLEVVERGDPYPELVSESAAAIAAALDAPHTLAYQSAGPNKQAWLGPDLQDRLDQAREAGKRRVVVAPFGFLTEHIETLYDLDIEAARLAQSFGLEFVRVPALDAHPRLIDALEKVALALL